MSYLLIDLEKNTLSLQSLSSHGKVYLFAKRKANRRIAKQFAAQHPHAKVYRVSKEQRLAEPLIKKLKKIIQSHPKATILVASHSKKVRHGMDKLLHRYPDAQMILMDHAHTHEVEKPSENQKIEANPMVQPASHAPIIMIPAATAPLPAALPSPVAPAQLPILPETETVAEAENEMPVLPQPTSVAEYELQNTHQAIVLLKKNHPKKKKMLAETLSCNLRLLPDATARLIDELENLGVISIDIMENVRYR